MNDETSHEVNEATSGYLFQTDAYFVDMDKDLTKYQVVNVSTGIVEYEDTKLPIAINYAKILTQWLQEVQDNDAILWPQQNQNAPSNGEILH